MKVLSHALGTKPSSFILHASSLFLLSSHSDLTQLRTAEHKLVVCSRGEGPHGLRPTIVDEDRDEGCERGQPERPLAVSKREEVEPLLRRLEPRRGGWSRAAIGTTVCRSSEVSEQARRADSEFETAAYALRHP